MAPVIASPRPQFSTEGCYLPLDRSFGRQQNAARTRCFERQRHDSRQSIRTTRARPPTPGSARRRAARHREAEHANRRPAAHRRDPAQRPDRPGPGTTDRLDGREEHKPTRRAPMTHGARPSRAPARGSAAVTRRESTVATMEIASIRTPRPHGAGKPNDRDRAQSEHADAARNRHRQTAPSRTRSTHDERRSGTRERARRCDRPHPEVPLAHRPERTNKHDLLEETHEHVEKTVCPIPMLNRRPRPRKPTTRRGPQHTHPARRLPPPGRPDGGRPPALPCRPTRRWSCMPGAAPDSQRTRRCANRQPCARRPTNRNVTSP